MSDENFSRVADWLNYIKDKRYFQRNAAVALDNLGDEEAVPALTRAMQNPDELIRGHAAWALGKIGNHKAKQVLETNLARETSEYVRGEIEEMLAL